MNACSGWNLISDGLLQPAKLKHIVIIYDFSPALLFALQALIILECKHTFGIMAEHPFT